MARAAWPKFPLPSQRVLLIGVLFCAVLVLGVRLNDVGRVLRGEVELQVSPTPVVAEESATENASSESAAEDASPPAGAGGATLDSMPPETTDDALDEGNISRSEIELLQQLAARRTALDKREKLLDQRETLLSIAEKKLESKVAELADIRRALEELLGQAGKEQEAQLASLVKMYETMKPKDAARIFAQMDLPVLMRVMQNMKESKAAVILAEMPAERAKEVTMAMLVQKEAFSTDPAVQAARAEKESRAAPVPSPGPAPGPAARESPEADGAAGAQPAAVDLPLEPAEPPAPAQPAAPAPAQNAAP